MTAKLNIKIVGIDPQSQSVLVACNTSESVKALDEYAPIAFSMVGHEATSPEEFLQSIVSIANIQARAQDEMDKKAATFNLDAWIGASTSVDLPPDPKENSVQNGSITIPAAGESQLSPIQNPEVSL